VNTTISHGDVSIDETIYFVEILVTPLLGKPAISKLNLIRFVNELNLGHSLDKASCVKAFPSLFKGLGLMNSEVSISLNTNVEPFVQSVPRRVAAARKKPLQGELRRMEDLGVIEKIEEPTE